MTNSDSIKIKRSYKFRCTPNRAQQEQLAIEFSHARYVWNWALETRSQAYEARQELLNDISLSRQLTELKKTD